MKFIPKDRVILDSGLGYDIAIILNVSEFTEHSSIIELKSGKMYSTELMISNDELHHYSNHKIAELTAKYGYEKKFSEIF